MMYMVMSSGGGGGAVQAEVAIFGVMHTVTG